MKYFKHETADEKFNLYPFVCWHIGAKQSDEKFIARMIERVDADPFGRWVYLGDGAENAIMGSKGDVYAQTMGPQEQWEVLHTLLMPIQHKGLFVVKGNHGNRTYKETGLDFDGTLARALDLPYMGTAAFMRLRVGSQRYTGFFHHGGDSGVAIASKVNAAKKPEAFVNADVIVTAHSHVLMDLPPNYRAKLGKDGVEWDTQYSYIAGSAYDSRSGYAEDKLYPPIIPSHMKIEFSGEEKMLTSTLYRARA